MNTPHTYNLLNTRLYTLLYTVLYCPLYSTPLYTKHYFDKLVQMQLYSYCLARFNQMSTWTPHTPILYWTLHCILYCTLYCTLYCRVHHCKLNVNETSYYKYNYVLIVLLVSFNPLSAWTPLIPILYWKLLFILFCTPYYSVHCTVHYCILNVT